jgi:hypothetical protein
VGVFGAGPTGTGGSGVGGNPGSGGSTKTYGGGGGGARTSSAVAPGTGAVRIVWPAATRTFPSTNVGLP